MPGRLVLAGDGPDRRTVEAELARAGLSDRVVLLGRVDGADKLRLLASARVVAMPSRYETFGIVAAEALACGTPVVAFEIPSLREVVIPGTGVLVPAFDVPAFAEALAELANAPERVEQLGRSGRERAREYDWDDVAERQEAVYLRAVAEARGARGAGRR
jgi:glycosyltransferase involved in cell wall biosynthesis